MEKEVDHRIPFLDVLINNNCSHAPITSVYRKKTFTGLLTNYFSFSPYSYKLGLIRTLVDRTYKINSTWAGFHKDIKYLTQILKKNLFPTHLIERVINQYVTRVESEVCSVGCVPDKVSTFYFKLPYIGHYWRHLFSTDPIPSNLRSSVVYKFSCAGCNACYVGETTRHFSTRVRERLATDRASHVYKHLQHPESCRDLCSTNCFSILDCATTSFQLKIKESLHIHWEKPTLNQQVNHVKLKLYV